jgi:hypothetical protein
LNKSVGKTFFGEKNFKEKHYHIDIPCSLHWQRQSFVIAVLLKINILNREKNKKTFYLETQQNRQVLSLLACVSNSNFFLVLSRRSDRVESTSLLLLGSAQLTVDSLNFVLQHLRTSSVLLHHLLLRRHV